MTEKNQPKETKAKKNSFVEEPTGSATMVNLDGCWDRDFTDHDKD